MLNIQELLQTASLKSQNKREDERKQASNKEQINETGKGRKTNQQPVDASCNAGKAYT
jgi:hypothetical protein